MENKSRYQKSGKRGKEREKRTFWESKKRSPSPEKMAAPCSRPVSSGRRSSACRPVSTVGWAQTRKKHTNTQSTKLRRGSDVKGVGRSGRGRRQEGEGQEGRRRYTRERAFSKEGRDAPKLPFRRLDLPWPNLESNCRPFPLGISS
ncbi:hypothetical protein M440DRAFT_1024489 [Trichoderma longibrachiatum ATCC 18648]|uniref:Uncharacterized protein n=1 Tax=Trichoderma longibrachiatum ATCC 18648 TaxID=983965 RepID=A0A2T4CJU1_TRILO|nr:hypothetical protein M440DRAFT_1024489 [Trichoderma longibrachiatum ATCC 18648]